MSRKKLLAATFLPAVAAVAYHNADHDEFLFDSGHQQIEAVGNLDEFSQVVRSVWKHPWTPNHQLTYRSRSPSTV